MREKEIVKETYVYPLLLLSFFDIKDVRLKASLQVIERYRDIRRQKERES